MQSATRSTIESGRLSRLKDAPSIESSTTQATAS